MELNKIVVGIDFSEESQVAATHGLRIARHVGAELVLAHVGSVIETPDPIGAPMQVSAKEWESVLRAQLAQDRARLEALRERMHGQGVSISHVVRDGFADTGIIDTASELEADLIIVGTHGRTGFKRFFLGSISERVTRLSNIPVLVARGDVDQNRGYQHIIVPTDFSSSAESALKLALTLVEKDGKVELLHVWQLPVMPSSPYGPVKAADEALSSVKRVIIENAQASGQRLVERYGRPECDLSFQIVEGAAAHGIQDHLAKGVPDLLMMGSHGRRGWRRFLLGSVAEQTVRHASCSVMVVHEGTENGRTPE